MSKNYHKLGITDVTRKIVKKCEIVFRHHHPEFDEIHLSFNKIIYEMGNFYLKKLDKEAQEKLNKYESELS